MLFIQYSFDMSTTNNIIRTYLYEFTWILIRLNKNYAISYYNFLHTRYTYFKCIWFLFEKLKQIDQLCIILLFIITIINVTIKYNFLLFTPTYIYIFELQLNQLHFTFRIIIILYLYFIILSVLYTVSYCIHLVAYATIIWYYFFLLA